MILRSIVYLSLALVIGKGCGPQSSGPNQPATTKPAAVARNPEQAKTLYQRGLTLQRQGEVDQAIEHFYRAIKADPQHAPALNHFAWLRATYPQGKHRDGAEAVRLSERACKVALNAERPGIFAANCLDTLAAAYAEAGRFDDAVAAAKRAIDMAEKLGNHGAVRSFSSRLRLFQKHQPYHELP